MRQLTNQKLATAGLILFGLSAVGYLVAWLGQPSLENTMANVSLFSFYSGLLIYVILLIKSIHERFKGHSHS